MKYINKNAEPKALTEHRSAGGTWDDFSLAKGKEAVKNQLLAEQKNLCAYCTGRISFEKMKVEHWYPRHPKANEFKAIGASKQLDYNNLLGVCEGCYSGNEQHCDTSKAEQFITISPLIKAHIKQLSYQKSTGKISSTDAQHQLDLDHVLRLNILL